MGGEYPKYQIGHKRLFWASNLRWPNNLSFALRAMGPGSRKLRLVEWRAALIAAGLEDLSFHAPASRRSSRQRNSTWAETERAARFRAAL